jgi:hypothetical protein
MEQTSRSTARCSPNLKRQPIIWSDLHLVACPTQNLGRSLSEHLIVIDDENAAWQRFRFARLIGAHRGDLMRPWCCLLSGSGERLLSLILPLLQLQPTVDEIQLSIGHHHESALAGVLVRVSALRLSAAISPSTPSFLKMAANSERRVVTSLIVPSR